MRNMREQLLEIGDELKESIAKRIGEEAIKISEKSVNKCILPFFYESNIPMELLKNNIEE